MGAHLRRGYNISLEQKRSEIELRAQSSRGRPRHETNREEQSQREIQQPPDSRSRERPAGPQRGNDPRYQLSAAAKERLRTFKLRSAADQRNRYEKTSGGSVAVGIRRIPSPHQLKSHFSGFSNEVKQIDTAAAPNTTSNLCSPYEYRHKPSDSLSDPASFPSEPSHSSEPIRNFDESRRHNSGQPHSRSSDQLHQQPIAHVISSAREPERHPKEVCPQPHAQLIPCASAFDSPTLRDNLHGFWPTTGARSTTQPETSDHLEPASRYQNATNSKQPFASTPVTIYSTPTSFSVLQSAQVNTTPVIPTGKLPAPAKALQFCAELQADPTSRMLEVGEYLMRAERAAGRVFRYRGRGRGSNQAQQQGNQQEELPQ
ncbi:uncharacterized protein PGTG_19942 [Puccinia graminis f. sp. tritici CRL 75-36-700-3]|uniref:Uncharacterized protein n=1 Tax=Puccinia graminis f. sp. tritici (strain CRL 75-36-700-3 / race SCCL) TaxID=418459 RepID=E3LBQ7_PUCGT|nr:uncharacterized protein PGTG_19942 [Puccinia graminis f. sp. tritici CRL 75-36-700-3]EFP93988.2 hypothetical protein PGTG_19942 [Puccinia graminis f. sp. tritici CRL 75-36-700-3]